MATSTEVRHPRRLKIARSARAIRRAALPAAALSALLLAGCLNLPPPDRLAFDTDPRILRGSYLGTADTREAPFHMALSGDSSLLAASWPQKIDIWKPGTAELSATIETKNVAGDRVSALSIDGSGSVVAGIIAGDVHLWNAQDGALIRKFDAGDRFGACLYCGANAISLNPAGDLLAASGGAPGVLVFDTATGAIAQELETIGENIGLVAFSADGSLLAAASTLSETSYALHVWDAAGFEVVFEHQGSVDHSRFPRFAFSADGSRLAVGSATKVEVFDLAGGVTAFPLDEVAGARFWGLNPDGSQAAIGQSEGATSTIAIVDVATGSTLAKFANTLRGYPLWSADGRFLIADSKLVDADDFTVVQDIATGQLHDLELFATPTYVDSHSYTVTGNLSIDGGAEIGFSGTVNGNEGQRYLGPQARAPRPATLEIVLSGHPWRLYADQPYSLDHWTTTEPDAWSGYVTDPTLGPDDQTWHPLRFWPAS